ncbi:hypothetical protein [Methylobacterium frigidaeris]|uniref:Uncharacterized protein n=1 Tax=Methylobacterium frigidaeris TaxID=2038277 RepID=A0AA37H888_9HYPH|nr:hypothetical protein [Methylobacterium frigidaeris]GJD61248.1 hypothetical protein MPEAHAMD_1388 [Methylobacterium frigidaeris]
MNGQITYLNAGPGSEQTTMEPAPTDASNTIEKVRELLYGNAMRSQGRRVEDLREAMTDLEQRMVQRFNDMQKSIDALALSLRMEQSNAVRAIGGAVTEMGRQISALADRNP